jgi:hypothetical protein
VLTEAHIPYQALDAVRSPPSRLRPRSTSSSRSRCRRPRAARGDCSAPRTGHRGRRVE